MCPITLTLSRAELSAAHLALPEMREAALGGAQIDCYWFNPKRLGKPVPSAGLSQRACLNCNGLAS